MKNIRIIQELHELGITGYHEVAYNPTYEELFQAEMSHKNKGYEKGAVTDLGAVAVKTGIFTGRSPKDRYIVEDDVTKDTIHWGSINKPTTPEIFRHCKDLVLEQLSKSKKLYVVDAFCGTNKDTRLKVRFVMEVAWQAHFVTNMFIQPTAEELENFEPDFVVYNASKAKVENYKELIASVSANTAKLRKGIPDVMQGFNAMAGAAGKDGVLDAKTKELIAMALSVAARCDPCVGYHAKALVKLGATRAELDEMLGMCVYMGGGPSLMYAAAAIAAYEEFGGEKAA